MHAFAKMWESMERKQSAKSAAEHYDLREAITEAMLTGAWSDIQGQRPLQTEARAVMLGLRLPRYYTPSQLALIESATRPVVSAADSGTGDGTGTAPDMAQAMAQAGTGSADEMAPAAGTGDGTSLGTGDGTGDGTGYGTSHGTSKKVSYINLVPTMAPAMAQATVLGWHRQLAQAVAQAGTGDGTGDGTGSGEAAQAAVGAPVPASDATPAQPPSCQGEAPADAAATFVAWLRNTGRHGQYNSDELESLYFAHCEERGTARLPAHVLRAHLSGNGVHRRKVDVKVNGKRSRPTLWQIAA